MTLHLLKLSVGTESLEEKIAWSKRRLKIMRAADPSAHLVHTTRMVPKRMDEIVGTGSLYWVIKGTILCRQRIIDIEPFNDQQGIRRCHLVLDDTIVPTRPVPRRAFQGWRYLKAEDAPDDLGSLNADVPAELHRDLAELGLL